MTAEDEAFYLPWYERMRASYSKPQYIQNRVSRRFVAACHARDAVIQEAKAAADADARRAANAARMRESRARERVRQKERAT